MAKFPTQHSTACNHVIKPVAKKFLLGASDKLFPLQKQFLFTDKGCFPKKEICNGLKLLNRFCTAAISKILQEAFISTRVGLTPVAMGLNVIKATF